MLPLLSRNNFSREHLSEEFFPKNRTDNIVLTDHHNLHVHTNQHLFTFRTCTSAHIQTHKSSHLHISRHAELHICAFAHLHMSKHDISPLPSLILSLLSLILFSHMDLCARLPTNQERDLACRALNTHDLRVKMKMKMTADIARARRSTAVDNNTPTKNSKQRGGTHHRTKPVILWIFIVGFSVRQKPAWMSCCEASFQ